MPYPAAFFRILGIPEGVSTPDPYQLLGLDADAFDPTFVAAALQKQKQRLRQNLPNPQLIPLVAVVERDLDAAAALLSDDAQREAHHQKHPHQAGGDNREAKAQRWLALMAEQQPPAPAPPEPEPEPEPEPATAAHDLAPQAIVSFFESAVDLALGNGTLTPDEESQLAALALRMGIPADAADTIIEQHLAERIAARRAEVDQRQRNKTSFAEQVRIICATGQADAPQRERLLAIGMSRGLTAAQCDEIITTCLGPAAAPAPEPPARTWHIVEEPEPPPAPLPVRTSSPPEADDADNSTWVERHIVGMFVAGAFTIFIALVVLLAGIIELVTGLEPLSTSDIFSSHEPPSFPLSPVDEADDPVAPTPPDSPSQPHQPPVHDPQPPPPPPDPPPPATVVYTRLRATASTTNVTDDLLADVTLAMLASSDLVERYALKIERSTWADQLDTLLLPEPAMRVAQMVAPSQDAVIVLPAQGKGDTGTSLLTPEELQALADGLFAKETGLRYASLEALRRDDSPQSAAALRKALTHFGRGISPDTHVMAIRLIHALSTMRDPAIPVALARFIPLANSLAAHRITIVLSEGALSAREEQRRLPRASSTWLRKKSADFWKKRLTQDFHWQGIRYRSAGKGVFTVIPHSTGAGTAAARRKPAWQPRREPLVILSLATFCTTASAEQIRYVNTQDPDMEPTAAGQLAGVPVSARADKDLAEALRSMVSEITLLAKRHAPGEQRKIRAGEIAMETTARCVAGATALQQATVRLEAIGQLLLLVLQDALNDEQHALIEQLEKRRSDALATTTNVLVEMREHALFNVALWELMQGVRP